MVLLENHAILTGIELIYSNSSLQILGSFYAYFLNGLIVMF